MVEFIDIGVAEAIINDMAKPLQDVVTQALQKQAREFADRMGDVRDAHEAEMSDMSTKYEQYKQDLKETMDNLVIDRAELMDMVAPLQVWARIVLPKASAPSSWSRKAIETKNVWIADGKYSICSSPNAGMKKTRASNAVTNKSHHSASPTSFKYDRIFGPNSMNSQVFDSLSVYVNHGLESKHLMLFMYGRSGTGKSQTLIRPYTQVLDSDKKHVMHHSPLIERILETAFGRTRARARSDNVVSGTILARITCLKDRTKNLYDISSKGPKHMAFDTESGLFRIFGVAGRHPPATKACTSARGAVEYIQESDKHRGTGETTGNQKSSRGHAWYEVRMCCRSSSEQGHDDDLELGVFSFLDLGGVEKLQTAQKSESTSLTKALAALKTPFQAIAAKDMEWEAPDGDPVRYRILHFLCTVTGTGGQLVCSSDHASAQSYGAV
ncbi:kinesin motor domain-containing protein [Ampelomyces quisqualis]|uniref:Kinesin motor domain-containing protein n=1 Tax=Ampelomyces quisqualis TaxID=50730 RepID=A0A6A5Q8A6_AMPQU|nr:kinesin motor domain-containing protein [Ampelomyces quisqualis]